MLIVNVMEKNAN